MATLDLKQSVLAYIENADEKLLRLMKALAENYRNDEQPHFSLSEEDYKMLDTRRRLHLAGKSKSFTWEQVKQKTQDKARQ